MENSDTDTALHIHFSEVHISSHVSFPTVLITGDCHNTRMFSCFQSAGTVANTKNTEYTVYVH